MAVRVNRSAAAGTRGTGQSRQPECKSRAAGHGVGIDKIDLIVPVVTALVIGIYMGATGGDRPGWMTATPY